MLSVVLKGSVPHMAQCLHDLRSSAQFLLGCQGATFSARLGPYISQHVRCFLRCIYLLQLHCPRQALAGICDKLRRCRFALLKSASERWSPGDVSKVSNHIVSNTSNYASEPALASHQNRSCKADEKEKVNHHQTRPCSDTLRSVRNIGTCHCEQQ